MQDYSQVLQEAMDNFELRLKRQLLEDRRKVSGNTINAIYTSVSPDTATLFGPSYFYTLIYGRGPTGAGAVAQEPSLVERIKDWLAGQGEDVKRAGFIAQRIHKFGTLLYQGKDPRWPGQRQASTLDSVINELTLGDLRAKLGTAARRNVSSELLDLTTP